MAKETPIDIVLRMKDRATRHIGRALGQITRTVRRARDMVFSLKGALAGVGLALTAKSFIDTASTFERLKLQLETVEGSSVKAEKSFAWIKTFAKTTPYELEQVTTAFVRMRAYGMDPTDGTLKTLGDTSAAMGKNIMQAVEAMADAVQGENERLKEFGIKARVNGNIISYTWTDAMGNVRKSIAQNNPKIIRETLTAIWNEKYAGGMDKLSGSWAGMVSNMKDSWTIWKNEVMQSGPFQAMKDQLGGLLKKVQEWEKDGSLKRWAESTANYIIDAFEIMTMSVEPFAKAVASVQTSFAWVAEQTTAQEIGAHEKEKKKLEGFVSGTSIASKTEKILFPKAVYQKHMELNQKELDRVNARISKLKIMNIAATAMLKNGLKTIDFLSGAFSGLREKLAGLKKQQPPAQDQPLPAGGSGAAVAKTMGKFDTSASFAATMLAQQVQQETKRAGELLSLDRNLGQQRLTQAIADGVAKEKFLRASQAFTLQKNIDASVAAIKTLGLLDQTYYKAKKQEIAKKAALMTAAGAAEVDVHNWATQQKREIDTQYWQGQFESATTFYDALDARMQLFALTQGEYWQNIATSIESAMTSATRGVGSALAQTLVYGESFGKSMEKMGKTVAAQLIESFVSQTLNYIIQSLIRGKTAATEFAAKSAMNVSMSATGAAAGASLGGPIAAAAAGTTTAAKTQALGIASYASALASFGGIAGIAHGGKDYIPREEPWLLAKGEGVVKASENTRVAQLNDKVEGLMAKVDRLVETLLGSGGGEGGGELHITLDQPINIDGVQVGLNTLDHVISGAVSRGRTRLALERG